LQKWQVGIYAKGKKRHLGYFRNKDDAIVAHTWAEIEEFGQFAHIFRH
jgi:hypothetical protein